MRCGKPSGHEVVIVVKLSAVSSASVCIHSNNFASLPGVILNSKQARRTTSSAYAGTNFLHHKFIKMANSFSAV